MNTLTITSKAALILARATEKAARLKPRVRKTATYGVYEVESSDKSKWYTVKCVSATKEITCNCKATKPCYHISSVAPMHSYIARQKQEAEKAATPAVEKCLTCPELAEEGYFGFCKACWAPDPVHSLIEQPAYTGAQTAEIDQTERDYSDLLAPIYQAAKEYTEAQEAKDRADLFG